MPRVNPYVRVEALALGLWTQLFERANEFAFVALACPPVVIMPEVGAPRISEVALVQDPPDWMEPSYEFESPALSARTVVFRAERGSLPDPEWEY
jgi:hypothetical protein